MCSYVHSYPDYYRMIEDPIDMSTVAANLQARRYKSLEAFDDDIHRMFQNAEACILLIAKFSCLFN